MPRISRPCLTACAHPDQNCPTPYSALPRDELRYDLECKLYSLLFNLDSAVLMAYGSGAPLHSLSVLPGLGNVAWVYGYCFSRGGLEQMLAELDVEVNPWEWLGKVLPKGLFVVISIDSHLSEICFSGQ